MNVRRLSLPIRRRSTPVWARNFRKLVALPCSPGGHVGAAALQALAIALAAAGLLPALHQLAQHHRGGVDEAGAEGRLLVGHCRQALQLELAPQAVAVQLLVPGQAVLLQPEE